MLISDPPWITEAIRNGGFPDDLQDEEEEEIVDTWKIDANSDECQYCWGLKTDGTYVCTHSENYKKECVQKKCPVAFELPDMPSVPDMENLAKNILFAGTKKQ